MSLLKHDPSQTRLTQYYDLINQIDLLTKSTPELMKAFNKANEERSKILNISSLHRKPLEFQSFFQKIVCNADSNACKQPQGRRHCEIVKKFATSLYLYAGSMAYNLVQQNMTTALPCLRTVQRNLHSEYHPLSEGNFQFEELLNHLKKHNTSLVIAISEDATRLISRVEYDSATNRLVGFVLPCNSEGLPLADSFLATSFDFIESCFQSNEVSKLAYIYMAQPIAHNVPAFCLGCVGSTNCFTATNVLQRWQYIYSQYQKLNITVLSFGADGDSRLLSAMKISCQLNSSSRSLYRKSPSFLTSELEIPNNWTWFWLKKTASVVYIQDYVHVAVKLKSRLLKPSVILPMGQFLAGAHHLKILLSMFSKDQHGIRYKDIDHKDKQNFEAVSRITAQCVFTLLEKLPDAKGTVYFLKCMQYFIDAFLNKTLLPLERIRKAWYSIFFLRYWRQWLSLNKKYTIRNNFITYNAHSCIELNGHALILLMLKLRDKIPNGSDLFMPWLLGSQACEQTFRAARSMTGTFSTIVNFSLLGILRRLHRLQVQLELEAEAQETGIHYPRVEAHIKKVGYSMPKETTDLQCISNQDILTAINEAKNDAISAIRELGMNFNDKELEEIISKPLNETEDDDDKDDDDNDDDDSDDDDNVDVDIHDDGRAEGVKADDEATKEKSFVDGEDLFKDISVLKKAGLIEEKACDTLQKKFKCISTSTIPMYMEFSCGNEQQQKKFTHFIEVKHHDKIFHIRKSTAVWLFQECERVSADRLFRVRSKQPYSSNFGPDTLQIKSGIDETSDLPQKLEVVQIGDVCVFLIQHEWRIGKVLQFYYPSGKGQKSQQCKETSINLTTNSKNIGVVCSWFSWHPPLSLQTYSLSSDDRTTSYSSLVSDYAFTLSDKCFKLIQAEESVDVTQGVLLKDPAKIQLACAKYITLSEESVLYIQENLLSTCSSNPALQTDKHVMKIDKKNKVWKKYGCYQLTNIHKAHLCSDNLLDDIHIGAAQELIKKQFPNIGGLRNTVLQNSESLKPLQSAENLQIIHVKLDKIDHWVLISTIGCGKGEVELYDSLQQTPRLCTQTVIARYLKSPSNTIKIKLVNVALQKGSTDCGLYAIAMMTSIAHKEDPAYVIYDQQELRTHLKDSFDRGFISKFPISRKRRLSKRITIEDVYPIYCSCRLPEPEDGSHMVQCDNCSEWYHRRCLTDLSVESLDELDEWLCNKCS